MALTFGNGLGFRTIALFATAATMALVAMAGCGGSVIGVGPTGDDGGRVGDDGDDGGRVGDDGGRVNPACPAADGTLNGTACQTSGLTCPSGIAERDCSGAIHDLERFCNGAVWSCEGESVPNCVTPPPPPPPPTQCPDPSMLVPGQACPVVGLTCLSDNVPVSGCGGPSMPPPGEGKCTCGSRGWQCPVIALPCVSPPPPPPPSGTCPSADQVYAYGPCYGYAEGLNCAGNPQVCEGETFYDAFQCEGEWIPVATTICADVVMDGGSADAPFYVDDAGRVFE
jgi:hypothetical protein